MGEVPPTPVLPRLGGGANYLLARDKIFFIFFFIIKQRTREVCPE
jgi:hypothetical protein